MSRPTNAVVYTLGLAVSSYPSLLRSIECSHGTVQLQTGADLELLASDI